jgi:hypothetical protein
MKKRRFDNEAPFSFVIAQMARLAVAHALITRNSRYS